MTSETISIHALHEESDSTGQYYFNLTKTISIHALHEESDRLGVMDVGDSTVISIHALHEESDRHSMARFAAKPPFQSTLSMRRATSRIRLSPTSMLHFNPRSP